MPHRYMIDASKNIHPVQIMERRLTLMLYHIAHHATYTKNVVYYVFIWNGLIWVICTKYLETLLL